LLKLGYSKDTKFYRTYLEPSANVGRSQINQVIRQTLSNPYSLPLLYSALFFGKKALTIAFLVSVPSVYRGMATRHYFKKHGADGLILLFADPPKDLELLHLRKREKKFLENGYLKKKGGLTRKGIQYLRQILPRGLVLERLQDLKESRARREKIRKK